LEASVTRGYPLESKAGNDYLISGKAITDLNALIVFAKFVEANGFSEAARRLKMPHFRSHFGRSERAGALLM
jgi:hypothetical protein